MSAAIEPVRPPIPAAFGGLTLRQNSFVSHYLTIQNGTESARLAGYKGDYATLSVTAHQLLRNPKIVRELQRKLGLHIAKADEVLERLTDHARADLAVVLEKDGSFNLQSARNRGVSKLLRKLKVKTRYEKDLEGNVVPVIEHEFELHDAQAALNTLAKYHGLLIERSESVNLNINIERTGLADRLSDTLQDVIDITPES